MRSNRNQLKDGLLTAKFSPCRQQLSVHFPSKQCELETIHYVSCLAETSMEEIEWRWYDHIDFELIKSKARMMVTESRCQGYTSILENVYLEGNRTYRAQFELDEWARYALRGLELHVNHDHGRERSNDRERYIAAILHSQEYMRAVSNEVDEELLAEVSTSFSSDARGFSRMMGIADERAAAVVPCLDFFSPKYIAVLKQSVQSSLSSIEELPGKHYCMPTKMEAKARGTTQKLKMSNAA